MHGEYKVPGGKLVVADLDVRDGAIQNLRISGDFFLEPDTALDVIRASVEGASQEASEYELAERVCGAVYGAELLGITPEGVAIAVRRAIEGGT